MKRNILALILLLTLATFTAAQEKAVADRVKVEDGQSYLILSTKKMETMEKELGEVAAKGFRVLYGAPTATYDMAILLKRVEKIESQPYSYKLLGTVRNKTMEKELNDNAAQGYRLLPRTIIFKQGFLVAELAMLMEREPNARRGYEYKLIVARVETKLHKDIDAAIAEGFTPVTMITIGKNIVVMEKEIALKQ
ncbi:MAG: hypothetical protein ABI954_11695 [Pyrinomonadaceae bacterium]